jgi:hypothetical protein
MFLEKDTGEAAGARGFVGRLFLDLVGRHLIDALSTSSSVKGSLIP